MFKLSAPLISYLYTITLYSATVECTVRTVFGQIYDVMSITFSCFILYFVFSYVNSIEVLLAALSTYYNKVTELPAFHIYNIFFFSGAVFHF